MKNKKIKKLNMLDYWDLEEQESWFTDMSLKGWKLTKINNWFASFEESEPQKVNFRCDVFRLDGKSSEDKIELYKRSGWEHIGSRSLVQVFREIPGDCCTEVHTDSIKLAENVSILKRSIHTSAYLTLFFTLFIVILNISNLRLDPVRNYLDDTFIESISFSIAYLFLCFIMVKGMYHTSELMKKLKSGRPLQHDIEYKTKMKRNKWINGSVTLFLSIWVITVFVNLLSTTHDRFPPIPDGELPVLQMSDFMDPQQYKKISEESRDNYFKRESSFLVPGQYTLSQNVTVPNQAWTDNSGTYNPAIRSHLYHVRNEWLAKKFIKNVKEKHSSYDEDFQQIKGSQFDELWVSRTQFSHSFIALKSNQVYYVVYFGMEPVEELIDATYEKVK